MIERIITKNFRAFKNLDVSFSKINLIFGPNNAGKSSLLSVLNLLSQTLTSPDYSVPLLLSGKKEDLGTYKDLVFNHDIKNDIEIKLYTKHDMFPFKKRSPDKKEKLIRGVFNFYYHYKPRRHEIILQKVELKYPNYNFEIQVEKATKSDNYYITGYSDSENYPLEKTESNKVEFMDHFFPRFFRKISKKNISDIDLINMLFIREIKSIEYIGPFRIPPSRTYLYRGEKFDSVGPRGENAIDILTLDFYRREKEKIIDEISKWFEKCGICEKISINSIGERHFEIGLSNKGKDISDNIADSGYGCSQILPILVAGNYIKQNRLFLVEEPEIHLHPKAQAELGTFFYELSKKGIQSIVETHSEHLLLRLQAHVADPKCDLSPEDICVYYVYSEDGDKKCVRLELDTDGRFKDEWPQGFFPERFEEIKKIVKASI